MSSCLPTTLAARFEYPERNFAQQHLRTRHLTPKEHPLWDEYVRQHALGTPFHLTAWQKTIAEVFRFEPMPLAVFEKNTLRGVLPLFLVKNPFAKKALISIPFAVYGGALADSEPAKAALAAELVKTAQGLGVEYAELRNGYEEQTLGFNRVDRYVTFTQQIRPDEEQIMGTIPRKTRYMVRKSLKQSFETEIQTGRSKIFEDLYAKNLRKLGTPCFPAKFFAALAKNFGSDMDIRHVKFEGKTASAVLTFYFRDQVLPYYGASDPAFNALAPNNFMYYDLMRWAGARGFRTFDFGRSKRNGSGSYDFKAHWGMTERALPYELLLVKRKTVPNFTPANPIFSLPRKIWSRLPLPVTRLVGPTLLKWVP